MRRVGGQRVIMFMFITIIINTLFMYQYNVELYNNIILGIIILISNLLNIYFIFLV